MKTFTKFSLLIAACLTTAFSYAQELVTNGNFEAGTTGWTGNALNVVTEGGNKYNSANVAVAGNPWDANLSQVLSLTAGKTYQLKFDAWSDRNRTLIAGIGLNEDPWSSSTQTVNLTNTSQTFTLTLSAPATSANSRVLFDMGGAAGFVGIDNVSLTLATPPSAPTTSAPTPPARVAANVVSIFSDAYTNVTGTDYFPNWGQATTYTPTTIGSSDNVIKYANLNYQGVQFGSTQDISAMTTLHIDVWSSDPNAATFPIGIIWNGGEFTVTKTIATNGAWTSLDIPLSEFTGAVLSKVIQFKFQSNEWLTLGAAGNTSKYTTIYLDNIYFYTNAVSSITVSPATLNFAPAGGSQTFDVATSLNWTATSNQSWLTLSAASGAGNKTITATAATNTAFAARTATVTVKASDNTEKTVIINQDAAVPPAAPTPTMPAANVISVYSDPYTSLATAWDNWYGSSISSATLGSGNNPTMKVSSTCCFGTNLTGSPVDVSAMTKLHIDVFPLETTTISLGVVTASGEAKLPLTLTTGQWNSIDLPLSDLKANNTAADLTKVQQLGFWNLTGTFYFDNAFFYTGSYSTGISSVNAENGIVCYPNPVTEQFTVKANSKISEITVLSLTGQTIKTELINADTKTITLKSVASGNYLVKIKMANGQINTQKIVKL